MIRTFYWHPAANVGKRRRPWRPKVTSSWAVGNAGDLFNRDLLDFLYPGTRHRIVDEGPRLLLVGSVAHRISGGDVVAGIGSKGVEIPRASERPLRRILGVRGPITRRAFADAGHDVSAVRFEADPGLLLAEMLTDEQRATPAEPGRTIFIPHYRDAVSDSGTAPGVVRVGIDAEPHDIATEILRAEHVYTSSLHGVVFAHSLGRPCTAIAPASAEPLVKYEDYFASIGQPFVLHESLAAAVSAPKPDSPVDRTWDLRREHFPSLDELRAWGVA